MIVRSILAGIDDSVKMGPYLLTDTPISRLIQHYNLIAMNDCRLKMIHDEVIGSELKTYLSQLDAYVLIELLHDYISAIKMTTCKFDNITSCIADKVKHCTIEKIDSCTRVIKMNIKHLFNHDDNKLDNRKTNADRRTNGRDTPDRRKNDNNDNNDKQEIIEACTINNNATTYYVKLLLLFSVIIFIFAILIVVLLWAGNVLPAEFTAKSTFSNTVIEVIKYIFIPAEYGD